jgi:hypothetical protein
MLAAQEAKAADLRRKANEAVRAADVEEAVLRGMREAFDAIEGIKSFLADGHSRPYETGIQTSVLSAPRRGRQPGAISHQWRETLRFLYANCPDGFSIDEVVGAAHRFDLPNVRDRDAEERMRSYIQIGYIDQRDRLYRVSDAAASKYGFKRFEMNEAPPVFSEGAS